MTSRSLELAYLEKAHKSLSVLEEEAYSDVVREAQELVELTLKAHVKASGC